jgi:hypothetical protein
MNLHQRHATGFTRLCAAALLSMPLLAWAAGPAQFCLLEQRSVESPPIIQSAMAGSGRSEGGTHTLSVNRVASSTEEKHQ